ncbi:MAG TPA: ATP-binding protein [Acidimicrobiales bacterium]|nr:ATP-binding protein [Acidimicrobiales bacterium]
MVSTHRFRRDLPEVPDARTFVAAAVEAEGRPVTDDVLLVASELVTNAVRHGQGEVEVRVDVGPGSVRLEVLDEGHVVVPEPPGIMPVDGPGGWGLHLVRAVSHAWGSGLDQRGRTLVWAEVGLPAPRLAGIPPAFSTRR